MAQISLRAYVEYIGDRLARDALTEVVAQCRHVLESYPKFIDAYRLLARTLMEQEKNQDALDLFQRVLSANPNDFVAHIGISDVYHEIGSLDSAIWHLERAYEQAPSNIDLQEAIKELYGERDGQTPRKIHLTSGALARMYANGKLYDQALLELRKALASDPERLDLQVLMANTLWDYHQYVEAGKLAGEILRRLPNSVDANALLARMWLEFGKPAEAQPFLNNVKQLDPYLSYEIETGEVAPSDAFMLLMLDYTADRHASEIGAADWVSEIGAIAKERGVTGPFPVDEEFEVERSSITDIFGQAEPEPTPDQPQATPDWLSDALASTAAPAEAEEYTPAEQPPPVPTNQPDWLSEALGSAGVVTMADETAPSQDTAPPQDLTEEAPATAPEPSVEPTMPTASDAPDWMQEVLEAAASPAPLPFLQGSDEVPDWMHEAGIAPASVPDSDRSSGSDDMPDWLAETLGQPSSLGQPSVEASEPDWLAETLGRSDDIQAEPASDIPSDDMPDWLAETLGAEMPHTKVTPASDEVAPDWLAEMPGMPDIEPPLSSSSAPLDQEPIPDLMADRDAPGWLDDILSGKPEGATPAGQAEKTSAEVVSDDWLDNFLGTDESETTSALDEEWLAEPGMKHAEEESVGAVSAAPKASMPPGALETWNQASKRMVIDEAGSAVLTTTPTPESEQPDELPDWLAKGSDSSAVEDDESGGSPDALPDWLATADSLVSDRSSSDEATGAGELPDWLTAAASPKDEAASEEQQTDEEDNGLPDWLQGG